MTDLSTAGPTGNPTTEPPPTQRRPRVREVSSRFMSPSDHPRSKSVHRRQLYKSDENHLSDLNRSFDKPSPSITHRKPQQPKHHSKENIDHNSDPRVLSRPDTPIASVKVVPSRYRQPPNTISRSVSLNSTNLSSNGCAARLLQEAISTSSSSREDSESNKGSSSSSCPNSPLCVAVGKVRSVSDAARASMPDVDKWLSERNLGKGTGDCARSLNFSKVGVGGGVSLPPLPSVRAFEMRKGRKVGGQVEDVHSLRMLSNYYLQWRFANAKAEATVRAQKQEAEKKLYSLGVQISDIRDNVKKKRNELAALRRMKTLTTIAEAQMPLLEEWSNLEEEYSDCLSSTTNALLNSSVRLPVSGDVRIDAGELKEAMNSALRVVELIGSHILRFVDKAEEINCSLSELAMMAGGERALIEECGYLLSKTYSSQVQECSLMGSIMQLHPSSLSQPQKSEVAS